MRSSGSNQRRGKSKQKSHHKGRSRPSRSSREPARRIPSAEETRFLAGRALDPHPRIVLERGSDELSVRALDLVCPIGMGQRGLIVSAAGSGKTTFLKHICQAVTKAYPEMKVYCALVNERPEEVTDFKRSVEAEVHSSSIDQSYDSHIKIVDTVITEAFKRAAAGTDVMILLDSLTRLARVHNAQSRSGGRTMSGGLDAGVLEVPRRIFGAARNVEGQGSITILATILVDTGSRMDEVIFEEFKGTGNMELVLSKKLAGQWIYPAIDVTKSHTRRMEKFFEPEEYKRLELLHKGLVTTKEVAAMETLIALLHKHPKNSDLLKSFEVF